MEIRIQQQVHHGSTITFRRTSLADDTIYYWRVDVSDGIGTVKGTPSSTKTYCATTYCQGSTTTTETCPTCLGNKITTTECQTIITFTNYSSWGLRNSSQKCVRCGYYGFNGAWDCPVAYCSTCGVQYTDERFPCCSDMCVLYFKTNNQGKYTHGIEKNITCTECNGVGTVEVTENCSHDKSSQHYWCSHGTNYTSNSHP